MSVSVASANFAINGWGTAASFSILNESTQNRGTIVVTASSGAVNDPYVLFTFPAGAYPLPPLSYAQQSGGSGQVSDIAIQTSNTQAYYVYDGLPVTGNTYSITYDVLGI